MKENYKIHEKHAIKIDNYPILILCCSSFKFAVLFVNFLIWLTRGLPISAVVSHHADHISNLTNSKKL